MNYLFFKGKAPLGTRLEFFWPTYVIFFFSIANIFNELWAVISLNLKQIKLNDDTVKE